MPEQLCWVDLHTITWMLVAKASLNVPQASEKALLDHVCLTLPI